MSKTKTKEAITKKINRLNEKIDLLIVQGKEYSSYAREHYSLYTYLKSNF